MPMELQYPLFYLRGASGDYAIPLNLDTAQATSIPLFNTKEAAETFRTNQPATEYDMRPIPDDATFVRFLHHLQANNVMLLMLNPNGESENVETVTVGEMLQRLHA
jgi:hypothetical protein